VKLLSADHGCKLAELLAKPSKIDFDLTVTRQVNVSPMPRNQKYCRRSEPKVPRRIPNCGVAYGRSIRESGAPMSSVTLPTA
jgi:hypothetical protein